MKLENGPVIYKTLINQQIEMSKSDIARISKELIVSDKLQEAFDVLINFEKIGTDAQNHLDELILLTSRYNQVKKQSATGIISYAEESLEKNKIVHSLLYIINKLDDKARSIKIQENDNIIFESQSGSTTNITGDFHVAKENTKADDRSIEKLVQQQSTIKILFLSSNPLNASPLRLDKEIREIEIELIQSKFRDKFELIKFSATRVGDLQDGLLRHSPNFVHFSGHGDRAGIAVLDNKTDRIHIVQSEPLANLFKLFSNHIACVFLNSCYSDSQARLIRKFIPNVIGMKNAVPDDTAIEFAKVFYKSIGAGRDISFSFEFAKNSIDLNNIDGSDIPTML